MHTHPTSKVKWDDKIQKYEMGDKIQKYENIRVSLHFSVTHLANSK